MAEIYEGIVNIQNRQMRFTAALQGVEIAEDSPKATGSSDLIEVNGRKVPLSSDSVVIDITTPNSLAGLGGLGMASEPIPRPEIIELNG